MSRREKISDLEATADERLQEAIAAKAAAEARAPRVAKVAEVSEALARRNSIASLVKNGIANSRSL
jgi:hypothetical protein